MQCAIQTTLGVVEECPGETCPFWEGSGCFLERGLAGELKQREVAVWLVGLRRSLEGVRLVEEWTA